MDAGGRWRARIGGGGWGCPIDLVVPSPILGVPGKGKPARLRRARPPTMPRSAADIEASLRAIATVALGGVRMKGCGASLAGYVIPLILGGPIGNTHSDDCMRAWVD